ncbi:hypothetical protein MW887_011984 [Aspergillus wentii]|nr:hypothetical protein MW887_011984 [Aspergillus wentii]
MGNPTSTFKPSPSDDAASTYSVSSTATTLKGTELKKKWFSFGPKSNTNTDSKPNTKPISKSESRGNHVCLYAKPQPGPPAQPRAATDRVSRSNWRTGQNEIKNRLDRLEKLLERAIAGSEDISQPLEVQNTVSETTSSADQRTGGGSVTPTRETLSGDGYDGALLLESESGQSRWVSSLHYALLADEIRDVKMLLSDQASDSTTRKLSPEESDSPFLFSTSSIENLALWLPTSADDCFALLEIFYSNVDPMTRLIHKPSLGHRFTKYIHQMYDKKSQDTTGQSDTSLSTFEPLALAIFYSAVNSMSPESTMTKLGLEKEIALSQYRRGVELGLGREGLLTTASIEVLQAFVLLLSREDDMSKTWSLLGLVVRIALSQGLHREPSLFPSENVDAVQVELRRRLWHQICYLDFRSAESKGQEPTISDDDFTTLLPRNVNDEALAAGASPQQLELTLPLDLLI